MPLCITVLMLLVAVVAGSSWQPGQAPGTFNFVFIKVPKCASSTTGGVFRRIADNWGLAGTGSFNYDFQTEPGIFANHAAASNLQREQFVRSLKMPVFLAAFVRNPATRALSHFTHLEWSRSQRPDGVSPETQPPPHLVNKHLENTRNFMFHYLYAAGKQRPSFVVTLPQEQQHARLQEALRWYNFLGIQERLEESLVMLAHQLNLTMCDVLHMSVKISSVKRIDGIRKVAETPCLPLDQQPSLVQDYIRDDFPSHNQLDYAILREATARLDAHVQAMGTQFDRDLKTLYALQKHARTMCAQEADVCLWADNGCGYKCLNRIKCGQQ